MASAQVMVLFLYPRLGENTFRFDLEYYMQHHIPLAERSWESMGMTECIVAANDKDQEHSASEYAVIVTTIWTSHQAWITAQKDLLSAYITADTPNFTNVTPIVIVGNVMS